MHDPTDLLTSASWVRSAENADDVRRALRASQLGLRLAEREREALTVGAQFLEQALRAASPKTAEERAASSFSVDADALRILSDTRPGIVVDREKLEKLRTAITALARGQDVDRSLVGDAIALFAQLTRLALDRLRAIQETSISVEPED